METYYVPVYASYAEGGEGPLWNFCCQADNREHAIEQAKDHVKDSPNEYIKDYVWQFVNGVPVER